MCMEHDSAYTVRAIFHNFFDRPSVPAKKKLMDGRPVVRELFAQGVKIHFTKARFSQEQAKVRPASIYIVD